MHTKGGSSNADEDGGIDIDVSTATLFGFVWRTLAEMLGTAAAAAIVRRAAQRAAAQSPELAELSVSRDALAYRYTLPPAWSKTTQTAARGQGAFRPLVVEIGRLLAELTGSVVITRLEQVPELRDRGLVWRAEAAR